MNGKNDKKKPTARKPRSVGRPSEANNENIKDQILGAYLEICRREGAEAVTLQKVADLSKVALTSVRYHFQLKGLSLSQVALDYIANRNFKWINDEMLKDRASPDFDPVLSYIRVQFDAFENFPVRGSFLIHFYYICTTEIPLQTGNKELVEIARRKVLGLIHEGLGMKLYNYEGDTQLLAEQIHMLVMGGCMIAATSRDPEFFRQQKTLCMDLASQLLRMKDLNPQSRK